MINRYYTLGQDDVNGRGLRCTSRITSADFLGLVFSKIEFMREKKIIVFQLIGGAMEGALVSDETAVRIWDYNQVFFFLFFSFLFLFCFFFFSFFFSSVLFFSFKRLFFFLVFNFSFL